MSAAPGKETEAPDLFALLDAIKKGETLLGWDSNQLVSCLLLFIHKQGLTLEAASWIDTTVTRLAIPPYHEGDTTETYPDEGAYR